MEIIVFIAFIGIIGSLGAALYFKMGLLKPVEWQKLWLLELGSLFYSLYAY